MSKKKKKHVDMYVPTCMANAPTTDVYVPTWAPPWCTIQVFVMIKCSSNNDRLANCQQEAADQELPTRNVLLIGLHTSIN